MPTLMEIKARIGCDSYHQVVVVDASIGEIALSALRQVLDSDGATLLAVEEASTREVDAHPVAWPVRETPFGKVSASGRMFVLRRFAGGEFREVPRARPPEMPPEALQQTVEAICRARGLVLVVAGVAVPGAQRLRCGLRSLSVVEPERLGASPQVRRFLAESEEDQFGFFVPAIERERIAKECGWLCRMGFLGEVLRDSAHCVVEGGDFLCREEVALLWEVALRAPAKTPGMHQSPDRESPDRE